MSERNDAVSCWIKVRNNRGKTVDVRADQIDAIEDDYTTASWESIYVGTSSVIHFRNGSTMRAVEDVVTIKKMIEHAGD